VRITGNNALPTGTPTAPVGGLGGGIYSMGSVSLQASSVVGNRADTGGGGIGVNQGAVKLTSSIVSGNQSPLGTGAGIAVASGSVSLTVGSHVDRNTAADVGGIVVGSVPAASDTAVSVTGNSTVNKNVSTAGAVQNQHNLGGGGIAVISDGNIYIDHSQVNGNRTVGMYSGGIVIGVGNVTVTNGSQIDGNSNNGPGGGIAANFGGKVTIRGGSQVNRNIGSALGGGIVNFSGPLGLVGVSGHSQVSHNTLTNGETIGRAIATFLAVVYAKSNVYTFAVASGGTGGSVLIGHLKQLDVAVHKAAALLRGIQKLIPNPGFLVAGGGIATLLAPITITGGSHVDGNLSGKNITGSTHLIGLAGGVFQVVGTVTLSQGFIGGNRAPFGDGGGIWLGTGWLNTYPGSTIANNRSAGWGGGIYIGSNASAIVRSTAILGNRASFGGGIANKGSLAVGHSTIAGNHATHQGGGIFNTGHLRIVDVTFALNTPNNVA
jgi:fibronectin-binding autotransporter adhesin